jgi:hypothetical protein
MNKFQITITALVFALVLTLASCTTSTEKATDQLPPTDTQTNPPSDSSGNNPPATGPITLSSGMFSSVHHTTTGTAKLIKLENGNRIVRLEGFQTDAGPDVRVWVSETATLSDAAQKLSVYTDLGALRSTNGDLNYELPNTVDAGKIKSVVIWCRLASVIFGGAILK